MYIRQERAGDEGPISSLVRQAFESAKHAGGNEAEIVEALRGSESLSLSLVAEDEGRLIGHLAFSPVLINDWDLSWFGLAPVSVVPKRQRQGVGSALIRRGLHELTRLGANGCVVLGDPGYYGRFGFSHKPHTTYLNTGAYFQVLAMKGAAPEGQVAYAAAFG